MYRYDISFEVTSVCLLILMLSVMHTKRQLYILRNKMFYLGIYLFLALNMIDIVATVLVNHTIEMGSPWKTQFQYVLSIIFFILQQATLQVFLTYVMVAFHKMRGRLLLYKFFNILTILDILAVSTDFIHKQLFYFDEMGVYSNGRLHFIVYLVPALFGLYGFVIVGMNKKKLPVLERHLITIIGIFTILVFMIQILLLPQYQVIYFWSTLVLASIFFTLQSSDYYLNRSTGAFNSEGLMVTMADKMQRKVPFSILLMSACDFEGIKDGFSTKNKQKVYRKIVSEILQRSTIKRKKRKMDVFRDDDKIYILFYDNVGAEYSAMKIGSWVTDGIYIDEIAPKVKVVATMLLFDFPGRIQTEEEFYSVIKYFMTDEYYKKYNVMQTINEEFFRKKKRYDDVRHLVEEAIRTDGIEMYYQPIYSSVRDDFHSAEALVRLRDKDSIGFVSPEEFIPIAEQEHLILQLEDLILRKICKFIQKANLQSLGVQYIEVNLSGNQCMQVDLADQLTDLIQEYDIPPNFINFEVTETSTIDSNNDYLLRNMRQLQSIGSTFALDDYGSGASNLKYLVDYPFEIVKLDKSIVWAYFGATNPKTRAVLPYSVRMLSKMNVRIVAEGVETLEQRNELIRLGVDYLQGYYFSKPICELDYLQFLREKNCS